MIAAGCWCVGTALTDRTLRNVNYVSVSYAVDYLCDQPAIQGHGASVIASCKGLEYHHTTLKHSAGRHMGDIGCLVFGPAVERHVG